jgi:hypothetical protein
MAPVNVIVCEQGTGHYTVPNGTVRRRQYVEEFHLAVVSRVVTVVYRALTIRPRTKCF